MKISTTLVTLFSVIYFVTEHCNAARCAKLMSSSTGWFASPQYPYNYPSDSSCDYVMKADPDYYIEITFTKFKLEAPYKGEITDYIVILDGRDKHRQKEMTVDGSQRSSFTFVSLTPRVIVKFFSDSQFEYSGFKATYKFIKREGCDILKVDNGQSECDLNDNGSARYCEVTCDQKFVIHGRSRSYCQKGSYVNPPTCTIDPSLRCNFTEVETFTPTCKKDKMTGFHTNCNYTCAENYLPIGDGAFSCVNGSWEEPPMCVPDTDLMDLCSSDPESDDCPYTPEETENFVQARLDEMRQVEALPMLMRCAGTCPKFFSCPKTFCRYTKKYGFLLNCPAVARMFQKRYRIKDEKRKEKEKVCLLCQSKNCHGRAAIYFD